LRRVKIIDGVKESDAASPESDMRHQKVTHADLAFEMSQLSLAALNVCLGNAEALTTQGTLRVRRRYAPEIFRHVTPKGFRVVLTLLTFC